MSSDISASPERRLACAALSRTVTLDDPDFRGLYPRLTPEEVWDRLVTGRGLPDALRETTRRAVAAADPQRDLDAIAELGGTLVCPGDADWPVALDDLGERRPVALWVRGSSTLTAATERAVAIVGSRAATPYGTHVAAELAVDLGDRGWPTLSGGAYGIDAAAHRGSLASHAELTVAVLACGIDVAYPSGNRRLFADIAEAGVLISEWAPGASPTRVRFLWRNRLIAALGRGTVVAEMGGRSGARRTCTEAAGLGRPVMAVPGPVTSSVSAGCHALLRSGQAQLVTCADDVLALVDPIAVPADLAVVLSQLSPDAHRVLGCLDPLECLTARQVAGLCNVNIATIEVLLDALCGHGLVDPVANVGYRLGSEALALESGDARTPAAR